MSDITRRRPCIEKYLLGIINENGKFRVLIGKHLIAINCREKQCVECGINCSCFSGPMADVMPVKNQDEVHDFIPVTKIRLLCSGRTMYFGRFINLLTLDNADIDVANGSTKEVLNKLGIKF